MPFLLADTSIVTDSNIQVEISKWDHFLVAGLMVTAVKPKFILNKLIGIAGVDITFLDLFGDVIYFNEGNGESYGFVFDHESYDTLVHPLRAPPSAVSDDPYYTHIQNLEPWPEFADLLTDLRSRLFYQYHVNNNISARVSWRQRVTW